MIAFALMLLAVGAAVELLSLRHALDGVEYDLRFSKPVAEPDEPLTMYTVVTNRRRRFLPYVRVSQAVPADIGVKRQLYTESVSQRRCRLLSTLFLMPRQRVIRSERVSMPRRGRYVFSDAKLYGGDFLGLSERSREVALDRELVIRPRAAEGSRVGELLGGYMGEVSVNRFILEDPILTMGFREYTGREPMKQISWTATARAGRMMVKQQDYTVERAATVILNVDTFAFGGYGEAMLERSFALARSVCEALEARRVPYAFITNLRAGGMGRGFGEAAEGLGDAHLALILEGMGRAGYEPEAPLDRLLDRAAARASLGRMHIFITPSEHDLRPEPLRRLQMACGQPVLSIVAEREVGA